MWSSLSKRIDGPVGSRRTRKSSYRVLHKKTRDEAGRRQAAEGLRVCNSELGNVLTRSWFRIRLRHIQWMKSLGCGPGRKGFRPPLRMTARPHPRREATLTRVDFQGVKRLLKDSHGDLIPKTVSATRNRGARIALPRSYGG